MINRLWKIAHKPERLCVGLMSGTSLDGVDVALCRIAGSGPVSLELLHYGMVPYTPEEKEGLLALCAPETGRVDAICRVNATLGRRFGQAVLEVLAQEGYAPASLDFIASHGQTIHHMPQVGATLQIGELAEIAAVTGCVTVGDFRPSDMAYGGEGAPLIPYVDWALYRSEATHRVLINIGGIANLTALPAGGALSDLLAFDTGPGNVIIDNLMKLSTGGKLSYDPGGQTARGGTVHEGWVAEMAARDPFLSRMPPKSTGRELYTLVYAEELLQKSRAQGLPFEDLMASVTDYTAFALADALTRFVAFAPQEVYLSGGGLHNGFLMERLAQRLGCEIWPLERLGMVGDAKEAAAFALLGDTFLRGQPNNAPRATGADRPVIMGKLVLPS